ncbi:hypothetical protein IJT93_00220 [bacterium]|nr:hypothetical protein [bacterium]
MNSLLIPAAVFLLYLCAAPNNFNAFLEPIDKRALIPRGAAGRSLAGFLWSLTGWIYGWGCWPRLPY